MEKRKAERTDGVAKRQRTTSPTPLLRLLKQAEQCSLPYGANYYKLVEVGAVVIEGEECDAEEVLKDSIAEIDQSLQCLAQMEDLKDYDAKSSMDETIAWMHSAMDTLLEKIDHCLAQD